MARIRLESKIYHRPYKFGPCPSGCSACSSLYKLELAPQQLLNAMEDLAPIELDRLERINIIKERAAALDIDHHFYVSAAVKLSKPKAAKQQRPPAPLIERNTRSFSRAKQAEAITVEMAQETTMLSFLTGFLEKLYPDKEEAQTAAKLLDEVLSKNYYSLAPLKNGTLSLPRGALVWTTVEEKFNAKDVPFPLGPMDALKTALEKIGSEPSAGLLVSKIWVTCLRYLPACRLCLPARVHACVPAC